MAYDTMLSAIVERANSDTDFRDRLLADPRVTTEAELGLQIPPDWEIGLAIGADGRLSIDILNDEIPDDLLEFVSGGCCGEGGYNYPVEITYG